MKLQSKIERDGFFLQPNLLDERAILRLCDALEAPASTWSTPHKRDFARRDALQVLAVREQCESGAIGTLMRELLGEDARPARGILFDKNADANWKVPFHQDLTICVQERHEVAGFGPWSLKDDVPHVQPPLQVLAAMLTIRVHLDDCDASNGPLRVLAATHNSGRLSAEQIAHWRATAPEHICTAQRGDALLMRPLLLHASSQASEPKRRRVLHLEWANCDLPAPLMWLD